MLSNILYKLYAKKKAINFLPFYPKETQDKAIELGLIDEKAIKDGKQRFLVFFTVVMLIVLLAMIIVLNKAKDFMPAFLQILLLMEAANIFDGVFNHIFWPSIDPLWKIPGLEGYPNTLPMNELIKERVIYAVIQAVAAAAIAALISFIF